MRNITVILTLICLVVFFWAYSIAEASPYKGRDFPTFQQVQKAVDRSNQFLLKPLGKYKDSNGVYHYFLQDGGGTAYDYNVFRLDNSLWLIKDIRGRSYVIQE